MPSSHHDSNGSRIAVGILTAAAAAGAALFAANRLRQHQHQGEYIGDTPRKALRRFGGVTFVGRTVTINQPREKLYAFWRDFSNLPKFMENVEKVEVVDDKTSRWTIKAPAGTSVTLETEITADGPGRLIVWRSTDKSDIECSGQVSFRDAPDGRGTEVEADIAYEPPGGALGQAAAKLFQREPNIQARRELKRLKQLMETGEIATSGPLHSKET